MAHIGKAFTFAEVIEKAKADHDALVKRVAAMTPEERAEWERQEKIREAETEEILKQLRGPGFLELKL